MLSSSSRQSPLADEQGRFSPERAYRPRVSPPSVEDRDACAIYASVRKDATPSRAPVELALANLQKMLHRAGNVDGEGDGCGILVDIPRRIWAEEVRSGGHNPALALDPAFAVAHVFIERSADVERARHDAREILGRGGFRILAERLGVVDSQALGATAREEEPHFWQVAGLLPDAKRRERLTFDLMSALETELGFHLASFSASTCVYKVMGTPRVLGEYYPDLRDERFETIGCFGHNRYSTNTWPSFKRVQPFTVLGHNGEINTIEQLRQEAGMLGVSIQPGCSDSQDLNRVVDHLIRVERLSLAEAMEMVVPPIVDEIRSLPAELQPFYMYLRQTMGPFAQGPVALIARHGDECVFSADALGLRPLWKLETPDDFIFSSEPGVVGCDQMVSEPKPLGAGREVHGHDRPREALLAAVRALGDAARGRQALARAHRRLRGRAVRSRAGDRRALWRAPRSPATPRPGPRSRSRSTTGCWPASAGSATTSSSASRWPPTAPSRSARSATTGRWPRSRRSARTSPTTSRRPSPWSPTRRSTASARSSTSRPGRCSGAGPRSTPRPSTPGRSRPPSR